MRHPFSTIWDSSQLTWHGELDAGCGCRVYAWLEIDLLVHSSDCSVAPGRTWLSDARLAGYLKLHVTADDTVDTADLLAMLMSVLAEARHIDTAA